MPNHIARSERGKVRISIVPGDGGAPLATMLVDTDRADDIAIALAIATEDARAWRVEDELAPRGADIAEEIVRRRARKRSAA